VFSVSLIKTSAKRNLVCISILRGSLLAPIYIKLRAESDIPATQRTGILFHREGECGIDTEVDHPASEALLPAISELQKSNPQPVSIGSNAAIVSKCKPQRLLEDVDKVSAEEELVVEGGRKGVHSRERVVLRELKEERSLDDSQA
jgi:hypothetical protein